MKFISTILVLIGACDLINGKAAKRPDRVDELNNALLTNRAGGTGLDLTPTRNQISDCACLSKTICTIDNIAEEGEPCTGNCGFVSARINNGSCPSHLVLCCKDSVQPPTSTVINTKPAMISRNNGPNFNPTNTQIMPNCPCVQHYNCINGTICTDGCNVITEKINDVCTRPMVRCCPETFKNITQTAVTPNVPNPGGSLPSTKPTDVLNLDPKPQIPTCPCISFHLCYNDTPCTDGCGAVDTRINGDTCRSPNVRCCKRANTTTVTPSPPSTKPTEVLNLDPKPQTPTCPCISFHLCYNGTPCTDGCGAVNIRINDGTCQSPNVLCCKGANNTLPPPTPIAPTTTKPPNFDPTNNPSCPCIPHYICYNGTPCTDGCDVIDMRINHDTCASPNVLCCGKNVTARGDYPDTTAPKLCGIRNPTGVGYRILGPKNVAQFGEFPWMVAILSEEEDDKLPAPGYSPQKLLRYKCGGSLIHPQVVMTTTHCVVAKEKKFHIRAGEWNILSTEELIPHQDRSVVNVITHPEYYSGALLNDIALLILDAPVNITDSVYTVCLPPPNEILGNIRCITSGWGKNFLTTEGEFQTTLKKIELPIIPKDTCEKQLKIARSKPSFTVHESFVCAGGEEGKDACEGDGGSPLVCPFQDNPRRYYQAGIVSWGVGCGEKNVPGLYTNVSLFRNWVDQQMTSLGYGTSSYTNIPSK